MNILIDVASDTYSSEVAPDTYVSHSLSFALQFRGVEEDENFAETIKRYYEGRDEHGGVGYMTMNLEQLMRLNPNLQAVKL